MDIGELTGFVPPPEELGDECPFEHEDIDHTVKNELGGVGAKLGNNMANAKGTHVYQETREPAELVARYGSSFPGDAEKDLDPRDRLGRSRITHVYIRVDGQTVADDSGEAFPYPLTCAAHHIIPAQEALKGHPILEFMCKKGEPQKFLKNGKAENVTVENAKVCGNVGYNINGLQNGVWLPGNYAVGGGKAGMTMWGRKKSKLSDDEAANRYENKLDDDGQISADWEAWHHNDEEKPMEPATAAASAAMDAYMLPGRNYVVTDSNPKWAYVDSAVNSINGHFHDRHKDYSEEIIRGVLSKIHIAYQAKYEMFIKTDEDGCQQCKEANSTDEGVPPPYEIITRLNLRTQSMITHLTQYSRANIYTSKWMQAKMQKILAERAAGGSRKRKIDD